MDDRIMLPGRTIVLGGARSGKSTFAERLAVFTEKSKVYIATSQIHDPEMQERIDRHKSGRGDDWRTVEAPLDVVAALTEAAASEVILLDCATLWLSNQMLADADLAQETARLLQAIDACAGQVIVVSNEVGQGIVPDNALARRFRDAQGRLNQQLAAQSDLAVLVCAGLPLALKGTLPRGLA